MSLIDGVALAGRRLRRARLTGSLIATTVVTCIGTNLVTAEQPVPIVFAGRMLAEA